MLEVMIATMDSGIKSAAEAVLSPRDGVRWLISWQHADAEDTTPLPTALNGRDDVTVIEQQGRGLSRNRNNCLRHATGDILLIADDDCRYTHDGLQRVVDAFAGRLDLDLATFRMTSRDNTKSYPSCEFDIAKRPKGYYITSFEMALRRSTVIDRCRLAFDERFGLGAPRFLCGEEELFVHKAIKSGLRCRFFPLDVVRHDDATTQATRATAPGVIQARGAFLWLGGYRATALLRPLVMAQRISRDTGVSTLYALRHLYVGLFRIVFS